MFSYQGKLAEPGAMDIINDNRKKFESYTSMTVRAYENLNSELIYNLDAHGEIENDTTSELIYSQNTQPTEQSSQVHESNLASGDFMPKIPANDVVLINFL